MKQKAQVEFSGFEFERDARHGKEEWLTPPYILEALGRFDLDPCASIVRPWPTADNHFTIEDNGLLKEWFGRIWLNPPYGNQTEKWFRRMQEHNNGIALTFARTETKMFFESVWPRANAIMFLRGRVQFYHVTGKPGMSGSGSPSVLIAYGHNNIEPLEKSGLDGFLVYLR